MGSTGWDRQLQSGAGQITRGTAGPYRLGHSQYIETYVISVTFVDGRGDGRKAGIVQESIKRQFGMGKDGWGGQRRQVLTKAAGKCEEN